MELLIAGATASLLTLFDLDRTFYIPARVHRKTALHAWFISFIAINGLIAALLFQVLGELDVFSGWNPYLKAVVIGVGYLGLVRSKFATFSYQGSEMPFGLEAFYEAGKAFVLKRINRIAIQARREETKLLAESRSLKELSEEARFSIGADMLLTADERSLRRDWLLKVLQDTAAGEHEQRITLANYLKSGQMIDQ
jgi:hypothetical protein